MAVEPKFPISKEQRAQRAQRKANQTFEDVAEEILNGILCTYEPPNRSGKAFNRKPSGILRRPKDRPSKNKRNSNPKGSKSARVRWIDEQTKEDERTTKIMEQRQQTLNSMVSPTEGGCSVAGACMDAGIEVGLVSAPTVSHHIDSFTTTKKQMMNATEAIANARAKSPRNARSDAADIVFDDDGNPTYKDDGTTKKAKQMISLPPVPPPPNKKERFFPELCGVRINCGDDEAYVQVIPKYNFENSVNQVMDRCGNHMTDDDDELIMMMDELDNSILGEDIDEKSSDSFGSDVETLRNSINQVRNRNREQQEANTSSSSSSSRSKKPSKSSGTEKASKKKSMRDILDHYMVKEDSDEDGDDGTDWEEKMSPTGSSANFLRRVWPGRPGGTKDTALLTTTTEDQKSNDEDGRRTKSRSRSPSLFRRGEPTMPQPMIVHDVYESVELVKNDEKRIMKAGIGAVLKSIGAKLPAKKNVSPSLSISESATSDWDESIPIVHDLPQSDAAQVANTFAPIPTVLPNNNHRIGNNVRSPSNQNHVTQLPQTMPLTQPTAAPSDPMYPKLHPAHPLVNNGVKSDHDDLMERQSFITAHRLGVDPANAPNGQRIVNDDMLERQSFIGAYRQGLEEAANPQPTATTVSSTPATTIIGNQTAPRSTNVAMSFYPQPALMTRDDMMERQSFITAYRQGYDPMQRPASAPLSHEDIMERMSYISASRQGFDPHQNIGGIPSPPKQSRRERRNRRSKSPRRNNQGIEHQNSFQPNPINHGILYDHMGNPVYGHPAAFYNPTMVPIQRDPPVSGSHDVYPVRGDPNTAQQYYAAQNFTQPMYMNSNTPPMNDAMPGGAPYPYYDNQVSVQNAGIVNDRSLSAVQLTSIDENIPTPVNEESAVEPELTWEERTRQAWERIRGGISALTFETSADEKVSDDEAKSQDDGGQIVQNLSLSDVTNQASTTSNMPLPQSAPTLYTSQTLAQPHEMVKRVSFGEPQQLIYYDDQDENRSTMSLPGKSSKKKKQFRGSKLVGGVLGKVKNSFHKVALSRTMSSDTLGSFTSGRSSHSQDLDGSVIHQINSMPTLPYSHQARPLQQNYMYPSNFASPVLLHNAPQHALYHTDPRLLPTVLQHSYPNQMNQPNQNQISYQQQPPPQYANNPVSYPVLSNSSMYHTAPLQYQPQQQQPYSMPVPFRNDRRSL